MKLRLLLNIILRIVLTQYNLAGWDGRSFLFTLIDIKHASVEGLILISSSSIGCLWNFSPVLVHSAIRLDAPVDNFSLRMRNFLQRNKDEVRTQVTYQ